MNDKSISFHEIAAIGDESNLTPTETGNLVHRVAELRSLRHHSRQIISGRRYAELNLETKDGNSIEIDLVTVQNKMGMHIIHDYKPVNIQRINDEPWAKNFNHWLQKERNGNYCNIGNYRSMNSELRNNFQQFLKDQVDQHHHQLENYREIYSNHFGVPLNRIKTSVLPYYVNR